MKVSDIRIQAQLHISMNIEPEIARRFLNEGLEILAQKYDTSCKKESITVTLEKNKWIDLPSDLLKVLEIDLDPNEYEVYQNQIRARVDGEHEITYLRYPKEISNDTEEPENPKGYHNLLSFYIGSREISRLFGGENTEANRLMQEFEIRSLEVHDRLSNQKRVRYIKTRPFI